MASYRRCPGVASVRSVLDFAGGSAESPVESIARYALQLLGRDVTPQHPVVIDGRTFRIDLALRDERLAIEVDGRSKYAGADPGQMNAVIMLEKTRAAALNRAGWTIIRLTWPSPPPAPSASTTSTASSKAISARPICTATANLQAPTLQAARLRFHRASE